ncbi:probable peptidyl-tRNA hydrolase isoform X2 [Lates calcarifer]|uniref:peptidyl-tRNA hydrolase n=1 Tax=Lates calcarifer TaxID=8187 RepID=A0AAJ7LSE9_LATCA|nr:probable peptidyl-tRNA hydrolase isoform X2 [Lates calcarifer]
MKGVTVLSKFCRCLSRFFKKLLNFVTMRRLLTRVINRVLVSSPFTPAMGIEAEIHTHGRRKLVVGLGNPGMEGTRHSIGMAVLGALAARLGVADRWRGDKHVSGEVIVSEVQHTHVVLLRPRLLMNINGVSVAKAAGKYSIKPEDILLVHDELDKPLGKIAVKHGGSARGHNGVRSCVDCLQTDDHLLSSPAGDAQTSGWDWPAGGENVGGAPRPGPILLRGTEGSRLCSGPECGRPPLPALPATGPSVPLLTSRGQTSSTEERREGALSLSS